IADGATLDLSTPDAAAACASALQERLAQLYAVGSAPQVQCVAGPDGETALRISRRHYGNVKSSLLTADFIAGADYATLHQAAEAFRGLLAEGATVRRGEGERQRTQRVATMRDAMLWLLGEAERTTPRQRYKGLGEMNPEQLWETTMNPDVRRLLRVRIEDAIDADQTMTTLMGDEVEPRREFIEKNALQAIIDA
ncbi:MAG: DNA gyrase subunit B, partial [Ottowia sp.]|nr:DNA gyrase subunit B [Ottowia sp.]